MRNWAAMVSLLLPRAPPWLSLIAKWCLMGDTLWGQPWMPTLRLPYKCDGRSGRRMTVLWTFRRPSMRRLFPRQVLRHALLAVTTIVPATACSRKIMWSHTVGLCRTVIFCSNAPAAPPSCLDAQGMAVSASGSGPCASFAE